MKNLTHLLLTCVALLLGGCAGDIFPGSINKPSAGPALPGPGGAQAQFIQNGAYYQGSIDTSGSDWIYIKLDSETQVTPADATASDDWDIAYKGTDIKLNGGASGKPPSGAEVIVYGDKSADGTAYPFDSIDGAPPPNAAPYVTDSKGSVLGLPVGAVQYAMITHPDADQAPDTATGAGDHGWYRSSGLPANTITVRGNVAYILRTLGCRYWKMRMTAYDGTRLRFDVQEISGPSCATSDGGIAPLGLATFSAGASSTTIKADASDDNNWVYLDLSGAKQVVPSDPANDAKGWDIAARRSDFKLNGGVSGAGSVEIWDGLHDDWDARSSAPASGYHTDADGALAFQTYPPAEAADAARAACGGINGDFGWYYYSGFCNDGEGIHHISPRDVVYVVHDRNGKSWKLRILQYYGDSGTAANFTIEYAALGGGL